MAPYSLVIWKIILFFCNILCFDANIIAEQNKLVAQYIAWRYWILILKITNLFILLMFEYNIIFF